MGILALRLIAIIMLKTTHIVTSIQMVDRHGLPIRMRRVKLSLQVYLVPGILASLARRQITQVSILGHDRALR